MTANTTSRGIYRIKNGATQRKPGPAQILLHGITALALVFTGSCSSSDQQTENTLPEELSADEIDRLPRLNGVPLGHLKPRSTKKKRSAIKPAPEFARRPHVRWALDGEQLTKLDPPEPLDNFRLDFDETRRLTFNDLP